MACSNRQHTLLAAKALDISNVATLNVAQLNLVANTTLILGDSPLALAGSQTLGEGVVICAAFD